MGILFVLVFWAIFGVLGAGIGALILGAFARSATRGVAEDRRRKAIAAVRVFPFACLLWAGMVFVFQAVVNAGVLDRDFGLGDSWSCPLPNGYRILMIDVTDQGIVYDPRTQGAGGGVGEREDAVFGVTEMQVAGRYIVGGRVVGFAVTVGPDTTPDSYFILDTQFGRRKEFKDYEQFRGAAKNVGIDPVLQPIADIYSKYRYTWFDVVAGLLLCLPPLIAAALMLRWIVQLRRTREPLSRAV